MTDQYSSNQNQMNVIPEGIYTTILNKFEKFREKIIYPNKQFLALLSIISSNYYSNH